MNLRTNKWATWWRGWLSVAALCAVLGQPTVVVGQMLDDDEIITPDLGDMQDALRDVFDRVWAPRRRYADSPHMRSLFREVVTDAARAIVQVRVGGRQVALGTVVGPDGWILTKASALGLEDSPRCRLADGTVHSARVVGVDRDFDLAMLKIEATRLVALELSSAAVRVDRLVAMRTDSTTEDASSDTASGREPTSAEQGPARDKTESQPDPMAESPRVDVSREQLPRVGDWVATVGRGRDPLAVGVVSVTPRPITARPGYLGVRLSNQPTDGTGVRVEDAVQGGGASDAGVLAGDVIRAVNGRMTNTIEALKEAIAARSPGDAIDLEIVRGEKVLQLRAILAAWDLNQAERRALYQNRLGGQLSDRRFGFPTVLQHDTALAPKDCGGPVVDTEGRLVGINIARAGRTESYALPAEVVASRLVDLMSGKLAPLTFAEPLSTESPSK
ncbi:S1C family serine protease [Botrimarina hoheduenensis]|uniref:Serine endoprotease n=1 Tax=Botrimarina hoheduenensis TaxID=2528000 RepID=A0A5C5VZ73_9BACT|nr:S1C family serine protease [Botrimarina hoheduenensis]TWT43273.1 serine endoprotease [Botrimarina hoheduenensis]